MKRCYHSLTGGAVSLAQRLTESRGGATGRGYRVYRQPPYWRVGLITHKDCKPAMAEALGIPAPRTGHFRGMREAFALEDCDMLLVMGTPTLCAEDILYLPVTTEIRSLPQLTPEGLPLALARRAAEATRLAKAAADLVERGAAITSRALAEAAHISLNTACAWLRQHEMGTLETEAMLSVLQNSSYSVSDTIPAVEDSACTQASEQARASVDPPEALPLPCDAEPRSPVLPVACLAASHQLLWRLRAGSWQCPACSG